MPTNQPQPLAPTQEPCRTCKGKGGVTEEQGDGCYVSAKCPTCFGFGSEEIVDAISDALDNSMGPDWNTRLGAQYVADKLSDILPDHASSARQQGRMEGREEAARERAAAKDQWRCVNCKLVVSSAIEPPQCGACRHRTFAHIQPLPPPPRQSGDLEAEARELLAAEVGPATAAKIKTGASVIVSTHAAIRALIKALGGSAT